MSKKRIIICTIVIIILYTVFLLKESYTTDLSNFNYSIKEFDISNIKISQEIKTKITNTDETLYFIKDENTIWAGVIVEEMRQFYEISFEKETITPTVLGAFTDVIFLKDKIAMVSSEGVEIFDKSYKLQDSIETSFENVAEIYETQENQNKIILFNTASKLYMKKEEKEIIISENFNQYLGVKKHKDYLFFTEIVGTSIPYKIYDLKNERLLQAKELKQAFSGDNKLSLNWMQGQSCFVFDPDTKEIQNITDRFKFIKKKYKSYETSISTTEILLTADIGVTYINQGESIIYYNNLKKSILTKPIVLEILDSHIIVLEKLEDKTGFSLSTF